ncbi:MAG: hypothetical protein JXA69_09020 [Phycisphaerae bacterium]|nr:hypothetical protein [Phycisphaerae bacterium]
MTRMDGRWVGRRARALAGVGGLVLAVLVGVGCQGGGKSGDGRMVARPVPYIPDVPVPATFKLVDKMTDDYSSGGVRVVRHEYEGGCDTAALRAFYQEQMPTYRWTRISDQNIQGEITLRFEKGNESCDIVIRPKSGGWGDRAAVRVVILPIDRTGREPPPREAQR